MTFQYFDRVKIAFVNFAIALNEMHLPLERYTAVQ